MVNSWLPHFFYGSLIVFEIIFISEQIPENRSGALLDVSDKFITKLNVLAILFCSSGLKHLGKFHGHSVYITLKTQWLGSFARKKGYSLYHKS